MWAFGCSFAITPRLLPPHLTIPFCSRWFRRNQPGSDARVSIQRGLDTLDLSMADVCGGPAAATTSTHPPVMPEPDPGPARKKAKRGDDASYTLLSDMSPGTGVHFYGVVVYYKLPRPVGSFGVVAGTLSAFCSDNVISRDCTTSPPVLFLLRF